MHLTTQFYSVLSGLYG